MIIPFQYNILKLKVNNIFYAEGTQMKNLKRNCSLIEDIINGMMDWVRVVDKENKIVFVNKPMTEALNDCKVGESCYKAIGLTSPCDNCTSRRAVFEGSSFEKFEKIGNKTFSVMSSPLRNEYDEIIASVEVLRDITQLKELQDIVMKQNQKLQDDLMIAKKLQCNLLPKNLQQEKVSFSFVYQPCEDLGGDFLDIFEIDNDHIGIYIADVSGHGIPASMLTVFLRSAIDKKSLSPSKVLHSLYKEFYSSNFDHDVYITVFYSIINLSDHTIRFSNAGHNIHPIIFNKHDNSRIESLIVPGSPISNWFEEPDYTEVQLDLRKNDRLFYCTDGIIELKNDRQEQFGEERLRNILFSDTSEPSHTLNKIISQACKFAGIDDSSTLPDDITIAIIDINE